MDDTNGSSGGVEFLDLNTENPNVFGMKVVGRISGDAIAGLVERIERIQETGQKARVYVDMVEYVSWDF